MLDLLFGLLLQRVIKQASPDPERLGGGSANAEVLLSRASFLDQAGEWQAALDLYAHVLRKWPGEHDAYVMNCVATIKNKMQLGTHQE